MKTINKFVIASIFLSMMFVLVAIMPGVVNAQYGCTYHSYERCVGNNLYWYDSCGTQQDLAQYCTNGCYNNSCQNNYNNYNYNNYNYNNYGVPSGSCTYHAYRLCVGNANIYWYDSCGTQQDLYSSCYNGQVCNSPSQYGQCSMYIYNPVLPPVQPANNYVAYYRTACYGNSIHWYDSFGVISGLYKNCADSNSCTLDGCSNNKCSNTTKCDGSTCAVGSADYNTYCATAPVNNHCGNGLCETTLGETNANCPNDCKINTAANVSASFFAKIDSSSNQWLKTTQIDSDSKIYFMISVANGSTVQVDNVNVSANIPSEISSLGNLQLNNVPVSGDIVSGINIGSIAPISAKSITFEGRTQTIPAAATKQAIATSNVSGVAQSDSVSINLNPSQPAAAVSSAPAGPAGYGFWEFIKRWYIWILLGLVLIFLFVIVFKRLSSEA